MIKSSIQKVCRWLRSPSKNGNLVGVIFINYHWYYRWN